ncbi:MAG: YfhO family protein, partial [Actinomycetota bacterium]|nr:YfhO family protein [Actinomycetota bacterium]
VVGDPVFEPERIARSAPGESADALARLGVTHVVLVDEEGATELVASPRFERVWRSPPLSIFAVEVPTGQPPPSSLVTTTVASSARLARAEDEHLVIETDATASTSATVAVGWSPKWHARLDGRPVALEPTGDGLLSLTLPAGEHTLALRFRPDGWDRLGLALSLTSALGVVAGVIVARVNSVRTGAAGVSVVGVSRRRWPRSREPAGSGPGSS